MARKGTFNSLISNIDKLSKIIVECDSTTGQPQHWVGNEYKAIVDSLKEIALLSVAPRVTESTHKYYANHVPFRNATQEEKDDVVACVEELIDVLEKYSLKHPYPNVQDIDYDKALIQEQKNINKRKQDMLKSGVAFIEDGEFRTNY
jgi:hypothetical protein